MRYLAIILLVSAINAEAARTFYADFADGSDSNAGTSTSVPWQRSPFMRGFSGTYTHQAGDRIVLKGGVVWDHTCLPLYINKGGTPSAWDEHTIDTNWYEGASWSPAVLDADGLDLTAQAPSGSVANSVVIVSGTSATSPAGTANNVLVKGITARNFLYTKVGTVNSLGFLSYGSSNVWFDTCVSTNWLIRTNHDAKFGGFARNTAGKSGIVNNKCFNCGAYGPSHVDAGFVSATDAVDNHISAGIGFWAFDMISNCVTRATSQAIYFNANTLDSDIGWLGASFDSTVHEVGAWCSSQGFFSGNKVRYVWSGTGAWLLPGWGGAANVTLWVVNNTWYNPIPIIQLSNRYSPVGNANGIYFINNTVVRGSGACLSFGDSNGGAAFGGPLVVQNNIFITDNKGTANPVFSIIDVTDLGPKYTNDHNLVYTVAEASALGLDEAHDYIPQTSWAAMLGTGVDFRWLFTSDIFKSDRLVGGWDIGPRQFTGISGGNSAPVFTIQPQNTTVQVGSIVIFTSSAVGTPTPTYQWYRDGSAIGGATSATYSFTTALVDNGATFRVDASNSEGTTPSNDALLTVTVDAPDVPLADLGVSLKGRRRD